jgi:hypothetical protein
MRTFKFVSIAVLAIAMLWGCSDDASYLTNQEEDARFGRHNDAYTFEPDQMFEFEITVENMSPATGPGASQPLSPIVVATHTPLFHLFQKGRFASNELEQIAEDAVNAPMLEMLNGSDYVHDVQTGNGVIIPGESGTVRIMAKPGYHRLSLVSMLVNTNDAFTGADAIRLQLGTSQTIYLKTYDAGTEVNTESVDHIPGPCCGSPLQGVDSNQRIHIHKGIAGDGDLDPEMYGWDEPIAKLAITLVE